MSEAAKVQNQASLAAAALAGAAKSLNADFEDAADHVLKSVNKTDAAMRRMDLTEREAGANSKIASMRLNSALASFKDAVDIISGTDTARMVLSIERIAEGQSRITQVIEANRAAVSELTTSVSALSENLTSSRGAIAEQILDELLSARQRFIWAICAGVGGTVILAGLVLIVLARLLSVN